MIVPVENRAPCEASQNTGNPDLAIWNVWEYTVDTWSGVGNVANVVRPETHVG